MPPLFPDSFTLETLLVPAEASLLQSLRSLRAKGEILTP